MNKERILSLVMNLQESRLSRDQKRLFFVEGIRNFLRAAEAKFEARVFLYSDVLCKSSAVRQFLRHTNVPILRLTPEEFRCFSRTEHASGIAAIYQQQIMNLSAVNASDSSWIVLHKIRNAGNFGTLIRSANACGNTGFVLLEQSIEPFAPNAVRASMGGIYQQKFVRASPVQFKKFLELNGFKAVGATPEGVLAFQDFAYPKPAFVMLGEERAGLSLVQRDLCADLVRIPMQPNSDSLNLGVAGSLLLYAIQFRLAK
jgi:RNA methyltransferase, TrmH family